MSNRAKSRFHLFANRRKNSVAKQERRTIHTFEPLEERQLLSVSDPIGLAAANAAVCGPVRAPEIERGDAIDLIAIAASDVAITVAPDVSSAKADSSDSIKLSLELPEEGLARNEEATIKVTYKNESATDVAAPLLVVQVTGDDGQEGALLTLDKSVWESDYQTTAQPTGFSTRLSFLGNGETAGVLKAGESVTKEIYWGGWLANVAATENYNVGVGKITADNTDALDLESWKTDMKSDALSDENWEGIWSRFTAFTGSTWGEYVTSLGKLSGYLQSVGSDVCDADALLAVVLAQTSDAYNPIGATASSVDASVGDAAFNLSISRSRQDATLLFRDFQSVLGYGWDWNYDLGLMLDSDGNVTVAGSFGQMRTFQPATLPSNEMTYNAVDPLDTGVLKRDANRAFTLTEQDGTVYKFTPDGLLASCIDQNGNTVTATTTSGRLTKLETATGASITLEYNQFGRLAKVTDNYGDVTVYNYDAKGEYLESVQWADGRSISYTYDKSFNVLARIDYADGTAKTYAYDLNGFLTGMTVDGVSVSYVFGTTPETMMVYDTIENGVKVATTWLNENGAPAKYVDAEGRMIVFNYDANGLLTSVDNGDSATQVVYDAHGNIVETVDGNGQSIKFAYDNQGRLVKLTDPKGVDTTFSYDAKGNVTRQARVDGTAEQWTYNADGTVATYTARDGSTVAYNYDAKGNVVSAQYSTETNATKYEYDGRDNLVKIVAANGDETSFAYDANDRLVKVSYADGRYLEYGYDEIGRQISVSSGSDYNVKYTYDANGYLDLVLDGTNADAVLTDYDYDALGRLAKETRGNGTYTVYGYDSTSLLTSKVTYSAKNAPIASFAYTYDATGQVATMTTLDGTWSYGYDATGQVTSADFISVPGGHIVDQSYSYEYDANGNRIAETVDGVRYEYSYDNMNRLLSDGRNEYTYDANGNMATKTILATGEVWTYAWNQDGAMISATSSTGEKFEYEYDALGNKTAVVHTEIDGTVTRTEYLVDPTGYGDIVAEFDVAGNVVATYSYGLGLTNKTDASGAAYYYATDMLGSTATVTAENGAVVNEYAYAPFGVAVYKTETVENIFEFVGEYGVIADQNDSLISMRARWYDSATGRFVSEDPLGYGAGDVNLYRYCGNDAIRSTDITGEFNPFAVAGVVFFAWLAYEGLKAVGNAISDGFNDVKDSVESAIYEHQQAPKRARDNYVREAWEDCRKNVEEKGNGFCGYRYWEFDADRYYRDKARYEQGLHKSYNNIVDNDRYAQDNGYLDYYDNTSDLPITSRESTSSIYRDLSNGTKETLAEAEKSIAEQFIEETVGDHTRAYTLGITLSVDTSSSMTDEIESVKASAKEVVYKLQDYGNYNVTIMSWCQPSHTFTQIAHSTNTNALINAINQWELGGDDHEYTFNMLQIAMNQQNPTDQHIVVFMTDEQGDDRSKYSSTLQLAQQTNTTLKCIYSGSGSFSSVVLDEEEANAFSSALYEGDLKSLCEASGGELIYSPRGGAGAKILEVIDAYIDKTNVYRARNVYYDAVGESVSLMATAFGGDSAKSYRWDFDNDGMFDAVTSGASVDKTWFDSGANRVRVQAVMADGTYQNDTIYVDVTDRFGQVVPTYNEDGSVKDLYVYGWSGDDTITVKRGATEGTVAICLDAVTGETTEYQAPTGKIIVKGYDGKNDITVDGALANQVFVYGGTGEDSLVYDRSASVAADSYKLSDGTIAVGSEFVIYDGIETVTVNAGTQADSFKIQASEETQYVINAAAPSGTTGDSIEIAVNSVAEGTYAYSNPSKTSGTWSCGGFKDVVFTGVEADAQKLATKLSTPQVVKFVSAKTLTVEWGAVANASGYELELATDENFNQGYVSFFTTETSVKMDAPADFSTYYCRVKALGYDEFIDSDWSKGVVAEVPEILNDAVWNLDDYSSYKSFKLDATPDSNVTATLYGLKKDGKTYVELQSWDFVGADAVATITGRNVVAENLWVTESAATLLGGVVFNGGELLLDKLTLDGTDGDDVVKIGTETVTVETPIFTKNPYEKTLENYRKTYGESSPIYQRIAANLDAAYQKLSKQVTRKTTTWGVVELNGMTSKFIGTRDVAINTGAGDDLVQIDALHYNYAVSTEGADNELDFANAKDRVNVDLGANYRQCVLIGDGGTLKLDGTFTTVTGTALNDRVVGSDAGLTFVGNGGSDSVTLVGGQNDVFLVGPRQSVVARGKGSYNVTIEQGDYSVVNASGVTKRGAVSVAIEGKNATVYGGLGTLEGAVEGDYATVNAGSVHESAFGVVGDHAVITTGGGVDIVTLAGDNGSIVVGAGDDIVYVYGTNENIRLGTGNDECVIRDGESGKTGVNYIWGDAGNDVIVAAETTGANYLYAGAGSDVIVGGAGGDYIYANSGDNILIGLGGSDRLYGGSGRDVLIASTSDLLTSDDLTYRETLDALFAAWNVEKDVDATIQLLGEHCVADGSKDWLYRGAGRNNLLYASQLDVDVENALERSPFNDVLVLDDPDAADDSE